MVIVEADPDDGRGIADTGGTFEGGGIGLGLVVRVVAVEGGGRRGGGLGRPA